ncbi:hypothetical protein [Stomatohabitans albus]|uniref:hypothetical protein n=1 Tax=Stomatohabitans albus TaxID=3110766 RepID=UPI00300C99A8
MNIYGAMACAAYLFFAVSLWSTSLWNLFFYAQYLGVAYAFIAIAVLGFSLFTSTKPIPYFAIGSSILLGMGITVIDDRTLSSNTGIFMAVFVAITLVFIYRAKTSEIRLGTIFDILAALALIALGIRIVLNPQLIHQTFFQGVAIVVAINAISYVIPRGKPKQASKRDDQVTHLSQ